MDFKQTYSRSQYINFFETKFLPEDFKKCQEIVDVEFQPRLIKKVTKIGEVSSLDMSLYEIEHRSEKDARVTLSRESFRLLAQYGIKRALILFISQKSQNYRLSLVTIDLRWDEGRRVKKEYSNPRRYSFFLGPDTKTHTPEEYLVKKGRVKDFEDLKKRFSVEIVNKEFYTKIALLFTKLTGGQRTIGRRKFKEQGCLHLPSTVDDIVKKEFAVRLIGRLVFCWFLKKKCSDNNIPLLSEELLSSEAVVKYKNYYHNILEPLFFEVLNTPIEQRAKKYKSSFWAQIPFLNGGLFNPHHNDFYEPGLMGISKNIGSLKIPDEWFKELFDIFETYNFTIDENTSIDVELSIDPEMLGRIFENLLAEINPETGETARKATGSYYTPRPIVEYMVDESLKHYLLTKTNIEEEKISSLLSYEDETVDLDEKEKHNILDALDSIRIIDPACGSGAFPMGILQKMLLILQKIDPNSKKWLKKQIAKIDNMVLRKKREDKLKTENVNYIHKLGIIQNAIYGVDIQPIAVEISKLRFFLSLIVDEDIDDKEDNRGIEPLPNLEFKFVCANTLIDVDSKKEEDFFDKDKFFIEFEKLTKIFFSVSNPGQKKQLEDKIKKLIDKKVKENVDRTIQKEVFGLNPGHRDELRKQYARDINKLTYEADLWKSYLNIFTGEAVKFFNPKYFSPDIHNGFDIVIGNPPYGNILKDSERKEIVKNYRFSTTVDISSPFIERGVNLLKDSGNLIYIITYAVTFNKNFSRNRQLLKDTFEKTEILSFDRDRCRIFENMTQSVSIMKCFNNNASIKRGIFTSRMFRDTPDLYQIKVSNCDKYLHPKNATYYIAHRLPKLGEEMNVRVMVKLSYTKKIVMHVIKKQGETIWIRTSGNYWYNAFDRKPYKSTEIKPLFIAKGYSDFIILLMNSSLFYWWLRIYGDGRHMNMDLLEGFPLPCNSLVSRYKFLLNKMKYRFMEKLFSVFDESHNRFITSEVKHEIDLIDLVLGQYLYNLNYNEIFHILNYDSNIRGGSKLHQSLVSLINQILSFTQSEDYFQNPQKQAKVKEYERQIDQMVYKLYGLTEEEIKIVEAV